MGLGFLLIFIGMALILIGFMLQVVSILIEQFRTFKKEEEERREVKAGGVLFIGPIPILFGTDKEAARWALILGVLMVILLVLFVALIYL